MGGRVCDSVLQGPPRRRMSWPGRCGRPASPGLPSTPAGAAVRRRSSAMNNIGLALSGGGFRASLYHLGLVRFLRDAGILPRVTHITSVSGGSILAAHLVLNWDRYNGTDQEFERVAREILDFVQLDVRNRIVRRFPFFGLAFALR